MKDGDIMDEYTTPYRPSHNGHSCPVCGNHLIDLIDKENRNWQVCTLCGAQYPINIYHNDITKMISLFE